MRCFLYTLSFCFLWGSQIFASEGSKKEETQKESDPFVRYVEAYVDLYQMSPECFFAYKNLEKRRESSVEDLVKDSLCSKSMKDYCHENKKHVEKVIEEKFGGFKLKKNVDQKECVVPKEMAEDFKALRGILIPKEKAFLSDSVSYLEKEGLKKHQKEISKELVSLERKHLKGENVIPEELAKKILSTDSKVLLSEPLLRLALGDYYDLEDVHLIQALKAEKSRVKKEFLKASQVQAGKHAKRIGLHSVRKPKHIARKISLFGQYYLECQETIGIMRKTFVKDESVFQMVMKKRLQRAIWRLRDLKQEEKAQYLEELIMKDLFSPERVSAIKELNTGISSSYLVHSDYGLMVVYKPHDRGVAACNAFKEVVVDLLAKKAKQKGMPLTYMAEFIEGKEGSAQFFVAEAVLAKEMRAYTGSKPRKLYKASGHSTKPADLKRFDWFIGNMDRNQDNYMFLPTGELVMIDHGMIFPNLPSPHHVSDSFVLETVPSVEVYNALKDIDESKESLKKELKTYLKSRRIKYFQRKVSLYVKKLESLIMEGEVTLQSEKDMVKSSV